ncbi:MAG: radical SAM protein [Clostridia bacterium]|nr:radical SAM protein [Clostridia bacterium]MEE1024116.1 radical SAM protein [Acutalibacteraceae bacterium]
MAKIHSFESMAAVDGVGLRCAVFFYGCPLRCVYCHNPDTWGTGGTEMSAKEVADKIARFKPYFKNGGGATFSGGEPLLHADFICETAKELNANSIGYTLDTSGTVELNDAVKSAIKGADSVILDLKFYNEQMYEKYCGEGYYKMLETAHYCNSISKPLWLRTVIVPGINDTYEDIKKYAAVAKTLAPIRYELLAFHTMGFFKYEKLGIDNPLKKHKALDKGRLIELQQQMDELMK